MSEQPNYYSIITATVRYDKELKANEKLLFSEITALANKSGYCTATNNYFAELYGKSKTTISNWINHLKEKGYLKVFIEKDGSQVVGRKLYPVDTPVKENKDTPIQKNNTPVKEKFNTYSKKVGEGIKEKFKNPIKEKFKENITSINNTSINNKYSSSGDEQIPKHLTQNQIIEIEFEKLWSDYPKKTGKQKALNSYRAWRKKSKDHTYEYMLEKLLTYNKYIKIKQIPDTYRLGGSTWFNGRFEDELDLTPIPRRQQFNQQPKQVRKVPDYSQLEQQQAASQSVSQLTPEQRQQIFREFGGNSYGQ